MLRRDVLTGLVLLSLLLLAYSVPVTSFCAPKSVELTLYTKAGLWADFIRKTGVLDRFKERMLKEKGVEVEVKLITAPHRGYREKVVVDFAAGAAGDVVWLGESEVPGLAEAGLLLDLTPYVEKWEDWGKFYAVCKELSTYDGKVYAVPFETAPLVLYYRKDIFKRAGLPVPWNPETWEDVVSAAKVIKERVPDVVPFYSGNVFYDVSLPVYIAGGRVYDAEERKWIAESPALLAAFKIYYDLIYVHKVTPKDAVLEKWDARKLFQEGKLAMMVDGIWCYTEKWGPGKTYEIKNREEVVGYTYIPRLKGAEATRYVSITGTYGWVVNAKAKRPELAWELVKDLSSPELIAQWGYETSHIVTRSDAVIGKYAEDVFLKWATTVLEHSVPKPVASGYKKYMHVLKSVIVDYLVAEGKTPEECVKIFAEQVTKELGEGLVKRV